MAQGKVHIRIRGGLASLTAVLILSACAATGWVSPYDATIDKGITQYAVDLQEHMVLQVLQKQQPGYVYKQDLPFFAKQQATLGGLIMRAETSDPGKGCALSDAAVSTFGDKLPSALGAAMKNYNPKGDGCSVILLKNVRAQLDQIALLEKTMKGLNQAAATDAVKISNQAVRAVLSLEALKKKGLKK
ncbi:hypothetical protein V5T82_01385 [Magnetovibrio sp. PR-2]|uniref:hypothetical protein n=1 Tax=Magnetovibrio sp. PR-2 TaxID=3120356 RepID=UPI002FCE4D01